MPTTFLRDAFTSALGGRGCGTAKDKSAELTLTLGELDVEVGLSDVVPEAQA